MSQRVPEPDLQFLSWIETQHKAMLQDTISLANINSGSFNAAGIEQVAEGVIRICTSLLPSAVTIERRPMPHYHYMDNLGRVVNQELAPAVHIKKNNAQAKIRVLLGGHMDTVFSPGENFNECKWLDENTLNGPGVTDLKGGLLIMLNALAAFEKTSLADNIDWEIVLNPDEEIGSPGSQELLAERAKACNVGLFYEPSLADGTLAGERKGSGNFAVNCQGLAAHAGREHHKGRNAIRALCDFVSALDQLNGQREGVTLNPGFISGGGAVNKVPDQAMCRFNIRISKPEDVAWCEENIQTLINDINQRDGITLNLHGGFTRVPKLLDEKHLKLYQLVKRCGEQLGLNIQWQATGGCCDGNNLSAEGLANIDTLGARGGKIHSHDEFLLVDSLVERCKLSFMLLCAIAQGHHNV